MMGSGQGGSLEVWSVIFSGNVICPSLSLQRSRMATSGRKRENVGIPSSLFRT